MRVLARTLLAILTIIGSLLTCIGVRDACTWQGNGVTDVCNVLLGRMGSL